MDPGRRIAITTHRLQADLTTLLRWAQEHDVALGELQATEASLDQVFHEVSNSATDGVNGDVSFRRDGHEEVAR